MEVPEDVLAFIEVHFAAADKAEARALLAQAPVEGWGQSPVRLLRCSAIASRGDLNSLKYYVSLLAIDWRDVVVAGEYEPSGADLVRVRDLSQPLRV